MTARILDLSADQYHRDDVADVPTLSSSIANKLLTHSPAHAYAAHPKLNPNYVREEDDKFNVGTVCHALLLQGLEVAEICDFPDWRTNAAKEARELARSHGRIPMLGRQWDEVKAMVDAVVNQLAALDVDTIPFTGGYPEQTLTWDEGDVACRARLDWRGNYIIDDLKTTSRSANPEQWARRALFDHGCDLQAAFYLRGVKATTGMAHTWRWVVTETTPPYAISVITPSAAVLAIGNAKVDRAIEIWKRCLETNTWPAYPPVVHVAELPSWIESQWFEREAREDVAA